MSISFTGPVRLFFAVALCASSVGLAAQRDVDQSTPADANGQVEISNVSGLVDVKGWDQPKVEIKGKLSGNVDRIDVVANKGRTVIKVVTHSGSRGEAVLRIRVPKGSELSVYATSADIRTEGLSGEQRLKTVSGDIDASLSDSDAETKTVSGDTVLHGDRKAISVRATSVSGDIHYERGAGDLEASTVSGDLEAALDPGKDIRIRTTSGDVTLTGRLGSRSSIDGEAISGQLLVHMNVDGGYRYEISSFSGDIDNCFDVAAERSSKYGPGSRLMGTRGDGKGEVRLKTLSGDINICDR